MLRTVVSGLLDLLAPPICPGCGWSAGGTSFCAACGPLVEPAPADLLPPVANAAALRFEGPAADAVRSFKYGGRSALARPLAAYLVRAALPYTGLIDVVVPLPLHPRKLRERGWNPSLLLARPVAEALGAKLRPTWLVRTRATRVQAGLSRSDRQRNVAGAFRAKAVPSARVLLIDDVRTTGATLDEAARTLGAVGHRVTTLALAWAPDAP